MINTYSPWAELSETPDLTLRWQQLRGRVGEYQHHRRLIVLDPRMPRRQARAVLCHELRHAEAGDVVTDCGRVNLRQEQRADRAAAFLLIDVRDMARAMVIHDQHLSASAVELRVSDALLRVRLQHLHPGERHYLTRVFKGLEA